MTITSDVRRGFLAKALMALFVSATLMMGAAGAADAAPAKVCKRNPENFSFYRGKCMSDKRIEVLKERAHHRGEDNHHHGRNHR